MNEQSINPVESGYAHVNGLKLYYEVHGNGKPLVLLHGSYMNIRGKVQHDATEGRIEAARGRVQKRANENPRKRGPEAISVR